VGVDAHGHWPLAERRHIARDAAAGALLARRSDEKHAVAVPPLPTTQARLFERPALHEQSAAHAASCDEHTLDAQFQHASNAVPAGTEGSMPGTQPVPPVA
jgi:hypothetical protein